MRSIYRENNFRGFGVLAPRYMKLIVIPVRVLTNGIKSQVLVHSLEQLCKVLSLTRGVGPTLDVG